MSTFSHSGNLGDIVYSLAVVKHFGFGDYFIKLGNVPTVIAKYNSGPVPAEYNGRLSQSDFNWLAPMIEAQPYINSVKPWSNEKIDYDLDTFRATVGTEFKANFIETYFQTFNLPYSKESLNPWLTVSSPRREARFVVTRTPRWRSGKTTTIPTWIRFMRENKVPQNGIFVGLPSEHKEFCELFNVKIPYYPCRDFLDMAEVIAGCEMFIGNQTMAYGIARGLNKQTMLEALSWRPLETNECFFPLPNTYYF
jgi:hypothetical protein